MRQPNAKVMHHTFAGGQLSSPAGRTVRYPTRFRRTSDSDRGIPFVLCQTLPRPAITGTKRARPSQVPLGSSVEVSRCQSARQDSPTTVRSATSRRQAPSLLSRVSCLVLNLQRNNTLGAAKGITLSAFALSGLHATEPSDSRQTPLQPLRRSLIGQSCSLSSVHPWPISLEKTEGGALTIRPPSLPAELLTSSRKGFRSDRSSASSSF
ncbi:hypothetical protein B0I35DRAFT_141567 [Stachybotrys elegans]|uniref:Uncharacterized protein n=1 Tax=Stachybotrys elegans TaxID=80388 RepID=A0A8K0T404_9HYPO|nr:hypothetical protein B0I35DRAFT_141567 [Stachybotrys elegans]